MLLAPAPGLTGDPGVRPVARLGLGGYAYQSGDARGPAGSASGLALVAGFAFDIPLDSARRRFTRIGSIAPFVSYAHALTGRMKWSDSILDPFAPPPTREPLRLDVIHMGLAVNWH